MGRVRGDLVNLLWDAHCCWEDFIFPLCKDESCGGGGWKMNLEVNQCGHGGVRATTLVNSG